MAVRAFLNFDIALRTLPPRATVAYIVTVHRIRNMHNGLEFTGCSIVTIDWTVSRTVGTGIFRSTPAIGVFSSVRMRLISTGVRNDAFSTIQAISVSHTCLGYYCEREEEKDRGQFHHHHHGSLWGCNGSLL